MRHFFKTADIEDMAATKMVPRLPAPPNKISLAAKPSAEPVEELKMQDCPAPEEDFKSWLRHQKSNWRRIRRDLKSEKKVVTQRGVSATANSRIGSKSSLGMSRALNNFMRLQDDTVLNSRWHIMQIE
mmetsp:Transcript_6901/g.9544  ORF Transcript_6901/g.9544 Transcript_6901/m.9544 type:complete len:128 (-) Transcript_6901:1237-1620(-)